MKDTLLECRNLHKVFSVRGKNIAVLKGVGFSIAMGEVVVISGRSGAGKSVLLWLLSGLDRPTSGEVIFEDIKLGHLSNSEMAKLRHDKVGIIFQNFNLVASWTALENVEAALWANGLDNEAMRRKAIGILSDLGLGNRMDNLPTELSIGEQQRVAVARTLANDPILILADEPTGDVDPETGQEIIEMLTARVKDKKAALIVATHGNFPLDIADRVLRLKDGELL